MSTKTTNRKPSTATMRAALVKHGVLTKDEAAALSPKALLEAFGGIADAPAPVKAPAAKPAPKAAPAAVKAKPAPANCGCGCGAPTITAKASFLPGHDARFAGMVGRGEVVPTEAQAALITERLQGKIDGIAATAKKKAAVKAAREAAKAAAKAAFDAAMA